VSLREAQFFHAVSSNAVAQALYRKWRPISFDDVVGQDHVSTTLKNQVTSGRVGHAYLFVGSRGCGKTTSARIFAKEINLAGLDAKAKHTQQIADAITEGRALDVIEFDAASHTGVDAIREIIEKVAFQPSELRYKVYIIDEVHMLSTPAFNALLKTLEEPPAHVVFILATTDPQKIPATVLSRCQRFNFKRVPIPQIVQRLRHICEGENIEADDMALTLIARNASGALRDAVSLLDQLASSSSMRISADDVREALGATDAATVRALIDGLRARDATAGLSAIQQALDQGADARQVAKQTVDTLRSMLQLKATRGDAKSAPEMTEGERTVLAELAEQTDVALLLRGIRAFSAAINDMRSSGDAQLAIEMAYLECVVAPTASVSVNEAAPAAQPIQQKAESRGASAVTKSHAASVAEPIQQHTNHSADISDLRATWKQVIDEVNRSNKPAAALMRSCVLFAVSGTVAQIKANHDMARERLNDPKHVASVTAAMRTVMGGEYRLQIFVGQLDTPAANEDDPLIKAAKRLGGQVRED
jgi:DNA polymerase-3 subunit gamma/tau